MKRSVNTFVLTLVCIFFVSGQASVTIIIITHNTNLKAPTKNKQALIVATMTKVDVRNATFFITPRNLATPNMRSNPSTHNTTTCHSASRNKLVNTPIPLAPINALVNLISTAKLAIGNKPYAIPTTNAPSAKPRDAPSNLTTSAQ